MTRRHNHHTKPAPTLDVDDAWGLPYLRRGDHVPCMDNAKLFLRASQKRGTGYGKTIYQSDVNEAKEICLGCPFRRPCADYATDNYEAGVWGATSDDDRAATRAARKQQPRRHTAGNTAA